MESTDVCACNESCWEKNLKYLAVYVHSESSRELGREKISGEGCIQTMTNFWQQSRTV